MDLLLSNDDANSRLHNTTLKVLAMGNYTLLPLPVEFLEASLEIIFQNAHQSS
jgi:hypothetical protein